MILKSNRFGLSILCVLLSFSLQAQELIRAKGVDVNAAMKKGQVALSVYLENVISEKNARDFGFKDLKEARSAQLGPVLKIVQIQHKALAQYVPGAGAKSIFSPPMALWYSVQVNGSVKSQLELVRVGEKWVPGEFGGSAEAIEVSKVQKRIPQIAAARGIGGTYDVALVQIPLFLARFIYIDSPQGEFMVPAMVFPERFKMKNGKSYPADKVLRQLQGLAKDIKEGTIR